MRDLKENVERLTIDVVSMRSYIKSVINQLKYEDGTYLGSSMKLHLELLSEHLEEVEEDLDAYSAVLESKTDEEGY